MFTPNPNRRKRSRTPCGPENGHAEWRLIERILARSDAADWPEAKDEWDLIAVWFDRIEPGACLCGHSPIVEHCRIANRITGQRAIVGNVCVTKFMGIPAGALFRAFRRVMADPQAGLNPPAARHAHARGWITDRELRFCIDTFGRPRLSARQLAWRRDINIKVACRFAGEGTLAPP